MATNEIQKQAGMSLAQFYKVYGTELQCKAALTRAHCSGLVSLW